VRLLFPHFQLPHWAAPFPAGKIGEKQNKMQGCGKGIFGGYIGFERQKEAGSESAASTWAELEKFV